MNANTTSMVAPGQQQQTIKDMVDALGVRGRFRKLKRSGSCRGSALSSPPDHQAKGRRERRNGQSAADMQQRRDLPAVNAVDRVEAVAQQREPARQSADPAFAGFDERQPQIGGLQREARQRPRHPAVVVSVTKPAGWAMASFAASRWK